MKLLPIVLAALAIVATARNSHKYAPGDKVPVYANFMGPYDNTIETYAFYSQHKDCGSYGLAWCPLPEGAAPAKKATTLAERLDGDRPVLTPVFDVEFLKDKKDEQMCTRELSLEEIKKYRTAIANLYFYELICDNLPVHGFLGFSDAKLSDRHSAARFELFSHFDFMIGYRGSQILQVNLTVDPTRVVTLSAPPALEAKLRVSFDYSVRWVKLEDGPDPVQPTFLAYGAPAASARAHWLSILNSLLLALILTGFLVLLVIRVVKNDIVRYAAGDSSDVLADALERGERRAARGRVGGYGDDDDGYDDDDDDVNGKGLRGTGAAGAAAGAAGGSDTDFGWKLVHGDVFRFPKNKTLLCVLVGYGVQVLAVVVGVFVLALCGLFRLEMSGSLYVAGIVLYALSAGFGGFVANRLYRQMGGQRWAWVVVLLVLLYPAVFAAVGLYLDFVALAYHSLRAMRFTTMLQVCSIYLFVGIPITLLGSIVGRRTARDFVAPCRTKLAPREIPDAPWFRRLPARMLVTGFLPFSSIFVELYYVYTSFWGHSFYSLYGVLAVVFALLVLVSTCVTITSTYFVLSVEDYRWWWSSFFCGGSTAVFTLVYSYFFWEQSAMTGFFQGSFFFGYSFVACLSMFLVLGAFGFFGSFRFVRYIYSHVKLD